MHRPRPVLLRIVRNSYAYHPRTSMQAKTLTPTAIFGYHVRHVVPLFQRPYVWNQVDQWAPLWEDVRAVAEQLLPAPTGFGGPQVIPHFLGAIVLDEPFASSGYIMARHVIDGQQRLTTLQLLLNAAHRVATQYGASMDAQALRILVRNEPVISQDQDEVFKVWPTDRDQDAFRAAMTSGKPAPSAGGPVLPAELADATVVRAHAYFVRAVEDWAEVTGDPDKAAARIRALAQALREHLKLVVIDLEPGDNAQVIFETLNHRGAPLLAADLIKNLVFQVALTQGLDVTGLYQQWWRDLDTDYWRQKVARGRQYVPRIDIFVNYWLIMRTAREVPSDRIFVAFREHLHDGQPELAVLLAELSQDARNYASLDSWSADSAVGRFRYRVLQALDSAVVTPILLWLLRWPADVLSPDQRDKALGVLESWLIRRAICRLTSKDINRLMLELLRELRTCGPSAAGDVTERFLLAQQADSRFWPTDAQVMEALETAPLYKALLRARLRMLIEAIEDHRRTEKSEHSWCPRNLTVEHLMPQAWREHWSAGVDEAAAVDRDLLIHTLGNLTLVTSKLNPALSNRPWTDQEAQERGLGATGKRTELLKHTTLKLNADLVLGAPDSWNEDTIRTRTRELAQVVVDIWPAPKGTAGAVPLVSAEKESTPAVDELPDDPGHDTSPPGKYQPLIDWLRAQTVDSLPLTFAEIEDILGAALPPSARNHPPYWYSTSNSLGKAVATAGFKSTRADLTAERVILERR
ncbi:DUF262 domain-containing protein [Micromonospora sp. CPCC 206060]|uniref:DUF262 domain-containing protein n=1 Tax=Micromonospora sp. CPCC 206060 TaxID=3122406 RepID=UPI002FF2DCC7